MKQESESSRIVVSTSDTVPSVDDTTRERLLLAGSRLFGEHGFEAVSLRQLTSEAEANLAAVSYHFGSKEGLIDNLIMRCLEPLQQRRIALLDEIEASSDPDPVPIEEILHTFLLPLVERATANDAWGGEGFLKLMGRCTGERGYRLPEAAMPIVQTVAARYGAAIGKTLPDLPEDVILWRLHFTFGVLAHTLQHREDLDRITGGRTGNPDHERIVALVVEFCRAGFRAPYKPSVSPKKTAKTASKKRARKSVGKKAARAVAPAIMIGLSLMSFGLTACQVIPPAIAIDDAELDVPASWSTGSTATAGVDGRWVDRFGDSKLTALIDEALTHSPDMQAAVARLDIARGNANLAGVAMRPTLNGSFNGRRNRQNFIGFPFGGDGSSAGSQVAENQTPSSTTTNQFGVSLDVSWELDIWGRMRAGVSAAVGELEASEAELRAARTSLGAQVAKAYFALSEARQQLALSRETTSSYQETEQVIRDRFNVGQADGSASGAQLRLAMADVASAKASVAAQEEAVERTRRQLEALVGRHPKGAVLGSTKFPKAPSLPPAGLPSELLTRRPDIQAAERRFASQGMRIREAELAVFPRLSLTASGGTSTDDLAEVLNSDYGVWSLAGGLIQPILTGGQLRAEKSKRQAEQRLALANLQGTVIRAFAEVETALSVDQYLAKRESALREAIDLAAEATDEARSNYRGGTGDILTVFTAQTRQLQSRSQLISARRARLDNRVDLHLALGGDFKPRPAK